MKSNPIKEQSNQIYEILKAMVPGQIKYIKAERQFKYITGFQMVRNDVDGVAYVIPTFPKLLFKPVYIFIKEDEDLISLDLSLIKKMILSLHFTKLFYMIKKASHIEALKTQIKKLDS